MFARWVTELSQKTLLNNGCHCGSCFFGAIVGLQIIVVLIWMLLVPTQAILIILQNYSKHPCNKFCVSAEVLNDLYDNDLKWTLCLHPQMVFGIFHLLFGCKLPSHCFVWVKMDLQKLVLLIFSVSPPASLSYCAWMSFFRIKVWGRFTHWEWKWWQVPKFISLIFLPLSAQDLL